MTSPIVVLVPIRTVSELNSHEHWRRRQRRVKSQRMIVAGLVAAAIHGEQEALYLFRKSTGLLGRIVQASGQPLVTVTMTRIAPRALDDDNLAGSQKGVRDSVAQVLGIDDRDSRVSWKYAQRKGKPREYAVEIRIESQKPTALEHQ